MSLRARFFKELPGLGLPVAASPLPPVTDVELLRLPEPAQRYLRFMGIVGRLRDWSFRASAFCRDPATQWEYFRSPLRNRVNIH